MGQEHSRSDDAISECVTHLKRDDPEPIVLKAAAGGGVNFSNIGSLDAYYAVAQKLIKEKRTKKNYFQKK